MLFYQTITAWLGRKQEFSAQMSREGSRRKALEKLKIKFAIKYFQFWMLWSKAPLDNLLAKKKLKEILT